MKLTLVVEGAEEIAARLEKLADQYPEALAAALYQEGFAVCAEAQDRCPVDEGRLEKSAYVAPPTTEGGQTVVEIGFGTEYAVYQHERTELHHQRGEAKFLQRAVDHRLSGMLERIGERTQSNAEKGIGASAIPAEKPTAPEE